MTLRLLSREDILAAPGQAPRLVDVPEFGGSVYVKGMSGTERDRWESELVEVRGKKTVVKQQNVRASLVARTVVGEDGKRLFTDDDIVALGRKSAAGLQRLFKAAQELSGVSDSDVDEIAGNSDSTDGDG